MKDVTIVFNEDGWNGVYIDDKLIYEGHSLNWNYILEELGINLSNYLSSDADETGNFPESLKDLKDLQPY